MIFDFSSLYQSFGLRKGSPYREFLNVEIIRLKEIGMIQNALNRDAIQPNCPNQDIEEGGTGPIIFEKVVLPFTIFSAGVLFALVFMILEICWKIKKLIFS